MTQKLPGILKRETVYTGRKIDLEVLTVQAAGGRPAIREVVRHPGAVVVLAVLDDGRVVFERNVRVAVGRELLELPAGTLDPGESPDVCAARELAEETGYRAATFEKLAEFYLSPGVLDERMHAYVARGLTPGEQDLDAGEQITLELIEVDRAVELCVTGQIEDGKTIATVLLYAAGSRGGRP